MQFLYVNPDPLAGPLRATVLGCGWLPKVPPGFTATAPCVILNGAGQTVVLDDTGGKIAGNAAVQTAAAPIVAAEAAAATAAAAVAGNVTTLQGTKLPAALTTNTTYQAVAVPTQAQVNAQVAALTLQVNALARLVGGLTASTAGT